MKFKNPDGKKIGAFGIMALGIVAGAMVSDGVVSLLHTPKAAAGSAEAKKEANMLLLKRGGVIAASGYAGAGIEGTDTTSVLVKAACYGMAAKQGLNIVKDLAATNPKMADTSTPTKKFIASAVGLACPSASANTWGGMNAYRRKRNLGVFVPNMDQPLNASRQKIVVDYK